MIEMALLTEAKETDNKVRWDADIDGTRFSLYIPKWRVPEPWPLKIRVTLSPRTQHRPSSLSPEVASQNPKSRLQPISAKLNKFQEHTKTIRYRPDRDASTWEIGEPYVPIPMTFDKAVSLMIDVTWVTKLGNK